MKSYKIRYIETLVHTFYVDADTPEEAIIKFQEEANNGDYNFGRGQIVDTEIEAEEETED